jgi:hypothetical protein
MRQINLRFRHPPGGAANVPTRVADLNAVFAPADIAFGTVDVVSNAALNSVAVGACSAAALTGAQKALFDSVALVAGQAVVFLASQLEGPTHPTGCAVHPAGKPGVVTLSQGKRWVLAHEIGHLLGLDHNENMTALMFGNSSELSEQAVPLLLQDDLDILAGPLPVEPPAMLVADMEAAVAPPPPPPPPKARRKARKKAPARRLESPVDALVSDALGKRWRRRSPHVINQVAETIERNPTLLKRYRALIKTNGKATVHRAISRSTQRLTHMVSSRRYARGSSLLARYAVLQPAVSHPERTHK